MVNIQIIESVQLPEEPVSPNKNEYSDSIYPLINEFGVGLSLLLEFLDNTFKTKEQVERELEIPVIGTIPQVKEY